MTTFSTVFKGTPTGAPSAYRRYNRRRRIARIRGNAAAEHALPRGTDSVCRALLCAEGGSGAARLSLGLRRAAIAARAARPNLSPRAERRQRPASSTSDRAVAGVLDHQGDEHRSKVTASRRENSKAGTCRAWGEVHSPSPAHEWPEVSRNLSRAPTASLRDRLRRHLTEPVRRGGHRQAPQDVAPVGGTVEYANITA